MDIQISYLFSRRPKFFSKVIAWGTKLAIRDFKNSNKVPSHTAYLINNRFVVESVFEGGYRVMPYTQWKQINDVIAVIPAGTRSMDDLKARTRRFEGRSYDVGGALYLAFRMLLKITLRIPVPKHNRLHKPDRFFCCELVAEVEGEDYGMKSPGHIMLQMQSKYGN